jgi:Mg2+ and Co2+ transporter CorA
MYSYLCIECVYGEQKKKIYIYIYFIVSLQFILMIHRPDYQTDLSKTPTRDLKRYLNEQKKYITYATGHNSFMSQHLLNIYIYIYCNSADYV